MRKFLYGLGLVVLLAASFSLGAMTAQVGPQPKMSATDGFAKTAAPSELAAAATPYEIMVRYGKALPTDKWSDPF